MIVSGVQQSDSAIQMYPHSFSYYRFLTGTPPFPFGNSKFVFYAVTDFLTFDDFDDFVSILQHDL